MINSDIDYLIAYLVTYCKLNYEDVLQLEIAEVYPVLFIEKQLRQSDYQDKAELMRMQTYYLLLPNIDSKKFKKPSDVMPFHWDELPVFVPVEISEEDYIAFDEMFKRRNQKS